MADSLFIGALDAFLVKVRADYDKVSDTGDLTLMALEQANLVGSNPDLAPLFLEVSNTDTGGDRAVWRHTYTTAVQNMGVRHAGGQYPATMFIKGYETEVFDPDNQLADSILVSEERQAKEQASYQNALDRAKKLQQKLRYTNLNDPFEVFNFSFTATQSFPAAALNRFFGRGNKDSLNEPLISTVHARKDGGATQSNAVRSGNNSMAFGDTAFWTARQNAYAFKDDVGQNFPTMQGKVDIIAPNTQNIIRTARELDWSEWKIATADNTINIHQNEQATLYSNPVLLASQYSSSLGASNSPTYGTQPWWLVDKQLKDPQVASGLVKIVFVPYSSRIEWEQAIDSIVYKVKEEFVYGWLFWQTVIGSPGDGTSYTI